MALLGFVGRVCTWFEQISVVLLKESLVFARLINSANPLELELQSSRQTECRLKLKEIIANNRIGL